jgi:hypothetical protein
MVLTPEQDGEWSQKSLRVLLCSSIAKWFPYDFSQIQNVGILSPVRRNVFNDPAFLVMLSFFIGVHGGTCMFTL